MKKITWKISLLILLISLISFTLPQLIFYLHRNSSDPFGFWILPYILPIYALWFVIGPVTLIVGAIGGIRALKTASKKVTYIVLTALVLILVIAWGRTLHILKIW